MRHRPQTSALPDGGRAYHISPAEVLDGVFPGYEIASLTVADDIATATDALISWLSDQPHGPDGNAGALYIEMAGDALAAACATNEARVLASRSWAAQAGGMPGDDVVFWAHNAMLSHADVDYDLIAGMSGAVVVHSRRTFGTYGPAGQDGDDEEAHLFRTIARVHGDAVANAALNLGSAYEGYFGDLCDLVAPDAEFAVIYELLALNYGKALVQDGDCEPDPVFTDAVKDLAGRLALASIPAKQVAVALAADAIERAWDDYDGSDLADAAPSAGDLLDAAIALSEAR